MIITCVMSVPVSYTDADGKPKTVVTRPGSYDYPMLNHKDPAIAEQLRVYRKHGRIGFDELLESDVEILKKMPADEKDKTKKLLEAVTLKPSPAGRLVKGVKKNVSVRSAPKAAKSSAGTVTSGGADKS